MLERPSKPTIQGAAVRIDDFREIWLVDFDIDRVLGEAPKPKRLTATELRTRRVVRLEQESMAAGLPPFAAGSDVLFVAFDAPAAIGCHLVQNWPVPVNVLDLRAEFRCLTSGLNVPRSDELGGALDYFGISDESGGLERLYDSLLPQISLGHALMRGRYSTAVARMESTGLPIDMDVYHRLVESWEDIQDSLIATVDQAFHVYQGRKFNSWLWREWLNRNHIRWPKLGQKLILNGDTFRDMAILHPQILPMKELRATLSLMRLFGLAVGADGRNRCNLRPFASKTGRNQPSTKEFIFGTATWLRGLIKPREGMALAYVDYEQQEFGIAAALSGDTNMMAAYESGDPYLAFAKQTDLVPGWASKESHSNEREMFKHCALGVQYCMGPKSLAIQLGTEQLLANRFMEMHKRTYPTYWRWSENVKREGFKSGQLQTAFGWKLNVDEGSNARSIRNFPIQANGAEMMRLACCSLTEAGIKVCAPVHDAILIEAPIDDIELVVSNCKRKMARASAAVLSGFPLRTEVNVYRFPERFMDKRGQNMWTTINDLLTTTTNPTSAPTPTRTHNLALPLYRV